MLQSTVTGGKVFYEYAYNQKLGKYQGQATLWPIVGDIVKKDNELCVSGAYEAAVYRAEDNDLNLLGQFGLLHIDQYDKDMKSKAVGQILQRFLRIFMRSIIAPTAGRHRYILQVTPKWIMC